MPPLEDLPDGELSEEARRTAENCYLLHVTTAEGRPTLLDVIAQGSIPTSEEQHNYCGEHARYVEDLIDEVRSVYFYAGRANPRYGSVALAFPPSSEEERLHSATPFDTGGLIPRQDLRTPPFQIDLDPDEVADRIEYCRESAVQAPSNWRQEFARWLDHYYPSGVNGYWTERPEQPDPEGLYSTEGNRWEAWAWEIRLSQGPRVNEAECWSANLEFFNELDDILEDQVFATDLRIEFNEFLERCITPIGDDEFCEVIEQWTCHQLH